jgi:hypothetical protein
MELFELPEWFYTFLMLFCIMGVFHTKYWPFKIMLIVVAAIFWFQAYDADLLLHGKVIHL